MRQGNVSFILIVIRLFKTSTIKVAPRVEKTEVVKKGWNFSNRTYFTRCMMKKHCSLIYAKGAVFSPYFYLKIIFYSAKQFDCVVNFKYKLNIFFIFKYKHKRSNIWIKKKPLISESAVQRGFRSKLWGLQFPRYFILYRCFWGFWSHFSNLLLQNFSQLNL